MNRISEEQIDRLMLHVQKQANDLSRLLAAPTWYEVTEFLNSWENYNTASATVGYCKDALGFVHIKGRIKSGTTEQEAFTLPVGFRPVYAGVFPSATHNGTSYVVALTVIGTSGGVIPWATTSTDHLLEGITFYAG